MQVRLNEQKVFNWKVKKIAVIGPGIVGMPMAALLANAKIRIGTQEPAKVMVIQRNSLNSGWKVEAINKGETVIGGIEPGLGKVAKEATASGLLSASHNYEELEDADVILVCVQTDKKANSFEPDYGPLFGALTSLAKALKNKPATNIPLVIFESTLAPSTMNTLIRDHFASFGLMEGKDILLGNSPNRVMPGRLVERVTVSDKLVAGLHPATPKMIAEIYQHIVTEGDLHLTNSLTAEVVKTLENAYRDVRIAYSSEVVRYCDEHNINFYQLRDQVNQRLTQVDNASGDPNAVPSGGILIPMIGVGGHCLPKDGILLWWRKHESGADHSNSLILKSREINDESPAETIRLAERKFGNLSGKKIAILGTAYRFNSEDTRNAPSLTLAQLLLDKGCTVKLHDPYVKPDDQNLQKYDLTHHFTNDLEKALEEVNYIFFGKGHKIYMDDQKAIIERTTHLQGVIDGCNLYRASDWEAHGIAYTGIGRGKEKPDSAFVDFVFDCFQVMEHGLANELADLIQFLNENYSKNTFNKIDFSEVQHLAASCNTGCLIADSKTITTSPKFDDFLPRLVVCVQNQQYNFAETP